MKLKRFEFLAALFGFGIAAKAVAVKRTWDPMFNDDGTPVFRRGIPFYAETHAAAREKFNASAKQWGFINASDIHDIERRQFRRDEIVDISSEEFKERVRAWRRARPIKSSR